VDDQARGNDRLVAIDDRFAPDKDFVAHGAFSQRGA
jgi:hypothetical protein